MAVQVVVGAVAAAIAAATQLVGNLQKGAGDIEGQYPEPNETEQAIANIQLEIARKYRDKIDDPQVLDVIYSQLPETKMSKADRDAFINEYTDIKKRVAVMAAQQTNSAFGQDLDSMVSRGAISQEAADRQKLKNEAAVNAVVKIWNKKIDASRIGMARNQYLKDASLGMGNSSIIADVDARNRQIYNSIISQTMSNMNRRQGAQSYFEQSKATANTQNKMINADILNSFNQGLMQKWMGMDSGGGSGGGGGGMDMGGFMNMFSSGGGGGAGGGAAAGAGGG